MRQERAEKVHRARQRIPGRQTSRPEQREHPDHVWLYADLLSARGPCNWPLPQQLVALIVPVVVVVISEAVTSFPLPLVRGVREIHPGLALCIAKCGAASSQAVDIVPRHPHPQILNTPPPLHAPT